MVQSSRRAFRCSRGPGYFCFVWWVVQTKFDSKLRFEPGMSSDSSSAFQARTNFTRLIHGNSLFSSRSQVETMTSATHISCSSSLQNSSRTSHTTACRKLYWISCRWTEPSSRLRSDEVWASNEVFITNTCPSNQPKQFLQIEYVDPVHTGPVAIPGTSLEESIDYVATMYNFDGFVLQSLGKLLARLHAIDFTTDLNFLSRSYQTVWIHRQTACIPCSQ